MRDTTRTTNHLIQEGIKPLIKTDKPDAATIYKLTAIAKRKMIAWVDSARLEDLQKVCYPRRPSFKDQANDWLTKRLDTIDNLDKLESIVSDIEDNNYVRAWKTIFN